MFMIAFNYDIMFSSSFPEMSFNESHLAIDISVHQSLQFMTDSGWRQVPTPNHLPGHSHSALDSSRLTGMVANELLIYLLSDVTPTIANQLRNEYNIYIAFLPK